MPKEVAHFQSRNNFKIIKKSSRTRAKRNIKKIPIILKDHTGLTPIEKITALLAFTFL